MDYRKPFILIVLSFIVAFNVTFGLAQDGKPCSALAGGSTGNNINQINQSVNRPTSPLPQAITKHTFGYHADKFLLDGKSFQIISGEMHYPRVPRPYWRDRMRKIKALGCNTVCTYMFWNLHEPEPGKFDFTGNLDIAEYIRTAQQEGLWVILRPGPYICSEWDFGGFPAWLLATADMKVRSTDPRFLKAAQNYMLRVGQELVPLQITQGGPIIMVQVENEYGSFGKDKDFLGAIKKSIQDAGFNVTLFTSDGPQMGMLNGGTLPDVLSVINFGGGNPEQSFASFAKFRQDVPQMVGEYWIGWFDHWGEQHHTTAAEGYVKGLDWMLPRGISINFYMVHGGTSFGFMSGANYARAYQPDISSYDYDSPIDEAGRPTPKFFVLREVIKKHLPADIKLPELPEPLPMVEIPRLEFKETASLYDLLGKPTRSEKPLSMEALGQSYGFILYRKKLDKSVQGELEITAVKDYALLYQQNKRLGVLDSRLNQNKLVVELNAADPLDILVENMGRINFGPQLLNERKGITRQVTLNGQELTGWDIYSLPMTDLSALKFSALSPDLSPAGPSFYRGTFELTAVGDTFLDMRSWGKGLVWVNGHNLGRYWRIGPQQSLFVPAPWLIKGKNTVMVFDLEKSDKRSIQGLKDPIYETFKAEIK